jgi:hypothetical protein
MERHEEHKQDDGEPMCMEKENKLVWREYYAGLVVTCVAALGL